MKGYPYGLQQQRLLNLRNRLSAQVFRFPRAPHFAVIPTRPRCILSLSWWGIGSSLFRGTCLHLCWAYLFAAFLHTNFLPEMTTTLHMQVKSMSLWDTIKNHQAECKRMSYTKFLFCYLYCLCPLLVFSLSLNNICTCIPPVNGYTFSFTKMLWSPRGSFLFKSLFDSVSSPAKCNQFLYLA